MWLFVSGLISGIVGGVLLADRNARKTARQRHDTRASNELVELSKLTGELAHEIKNPLSTIKVNLQLALEQLEGPDVTNEQVARALRKVSIVRTETDRLQRILDGFLQYIGKPELQPESMDINEMIGDIIDFYSPQAYNHGITLRKHAWDGPLPVHADAAMLKQVILNMFINAQQAMPQGGELMVRTAREKDRAVIYVSDTGCGMSPETQAHIFQPYYSHRPRGSGLGLATAAKIITAHQGQVSVESELDRGTSFSISLPLSNPSDP